MTERTISTFCSTNGKRIFRHESVHATMADSEINSFVRKFKALCQLGRSAKLTLSSNAGKATLHLQVDLGVLSQEPPPLHPPPKEARNGPARLRRREKRAAARVVHAEEALTLEEKEQLTTKKIK